MDKEISFILEFYEVNEKQLNKFNELLEDTMIKFQILKSDSELKEIANLEKALNEIREYIDNNSWHYSMDDGSVNFVIEEEKEESFCNDILQIIDKVLGDEK